MLPLFTFYNMERSDDYVLIPKLHTCSQTSIAISNNLKSHCGTCLSISKYYYARLGWIEFRTCAAFAVLVMTLVYKLAWPLLRRESLGSDVRPSRPEFVSVVRSTTTFSSRRFILVLQCPRKCHATTIHSLATHTAR